MKYTQLYSTQKYYLYRHVRLDTNQPFYIGIGTKTPKAKTLHTMYRRAYISTKRNNLWHKIANKTRYDIEILFETNNLEEILAKEIEFIKLYGRVDLDTGTLCNFTEGGEGVKVTNYDALRRQVLTKKRTGSYLRSAEACFKPVHAYNLDGKLIHSFASRKECTSAFNCSL